MHCLFIHRLEKKSQFNTTASSWGAEGGENYFGTFGFSTVIAKDAPIRQRMGAISMPCVVASVMKKV